MNIPLFCHHEQALNQHTLKNLRTNAFEQACYTLMLDNVGHNFRKRLEWSTLSLW